MAPVGDAEDGRTAMAASKEHFAAITRDYISQPRISTYLTI